MRRVVGAGKVVVVPNGVDSEFFSPAHRHREPITVASSGGAWTSGRTSRRSSGFAAGFGLLRGEKSPTRPSPSMDSTPTEPVKALAGRDGISLIADLPDLRDEIARHAVVVLPFVSGGGIKNKLLEAASLARAVVGSATALNGLRQPDRVPMVCPTTSSAWIHAILDLWSDAAKRSQSRSAGPRVGDPEPHLGDGGARSSSGFKALIKVVDMPPPLSRILSCVRTLPHRLVH